MQPFLQDRVLPILHSIEQKTRPPLVGVLIALIGCGILAIALKVFDMNNGSGHQAMEPSFPSAQELYPQALEEAQAWKSDAYLTLVYFGFRDLDILISFGFSTYTNPIPGLLVYFWPTEEGYEIELSETESPLRTEPKSEIKPQDWAVDSIDVARIAFDYKGSEFLVEHPEVREAVLQLTTVGGSAAERTGLEPQQLVWVMDYYQLRGYGLKVYIDPKTGDILADELTEPLEESDLQLNSN